MGTALENSEKYEHVIIAEEDVDLLVLLNGLGSSKQNVFFQKSGRGGTGYEQFSSTSFIRGELSLTPGLELFLHAFTGCDTTSAIFWQGKMKMLGVPSKRPDLLDAATTFHNHDTTHEEIASADNKCLVALYGGGEDDSLNALRYRIFTCCQHQNPPRSSAPNRRNCHPTFLQNLPPSSEVVVVTERAHQLGVDKEPARADTGDLNQRTIAANTSEIHVMQVPERVQR